MINLAIIGYGFVGKAVDYGFSNILCNKYIIDPKIGTTANDLLDKDIDATFICVPTPMGNDGSIDESILISAVEDALNVTDSLIVIKSTVIPSIIDDLCSLSEDIVYNPEFLTEKNAYNDFVNPTMHIFGGVKSSTERLEQIYSKYSNCNPCPVYHMTPAEASFVKYGVNCFLMSKVLWFNQFHDMIEKYSSDYKKIISAMSSDPRIGNSHMNVPGHDERKGAGGSCFSKDSPAFLMFSRSIGQNFTILEEIIRVNQNIRNSYPEPLKREIEQNIKFDYDI